MKKNIYAAIKIIIVASIAYIVSDMHTDKSMAIAYENGWFDGINRVGDFIVDDSTFTINTYKTDSINFSKHY